jgi:hypothetical protein
MESMLVIVYPTSNKNTHTLTRRGDRGQETSMGEDAEF